MTILDLAVDVDLSFGGIIIHLIMVIQKINVVDGVF